MNAPRNVDRAWRGPVKGDVKQGVVPRVLAGPGRDTPVPIPVNDPAHLLRGQQGELEDKLGEMPCLRGELSNYI